MVSGSNEKFKVIRREGHDALQNLPYIMETVEKKLRNELKTIGIRTTVNSC